MNKRSKKFNVHGITVSGGTHENIVVVIVTHELLDSSGSTLLELLDRLGGSVLLLKLVEDLFHVG